MPRPRIFVGILNWGLGHAARSLALLPDLEAAGCELIIGSDGEALDLLQLERPDLTKIVLPSYKMRYPSASMTWNLIQAGPRLWRAIRAEALALKKWRQYYGFKGVISDNRYGLSAGGNSVFLGHQLQLPVPWAWQAPWARALQAYYLRRFSELWVPDWPRPWSLTGEMGTGGTWTRQYLGPLSRLEGEGRPLNHRPIGLALVLSGPEPARSKFEAQLWPQLQSLDRAWTLIRGTQVGPKLPPPSPQGQVWDLLPHDALTWVYRQAQAVVIRSGYSSLMDLAQVGQGRLILVPTQGQPEQLNLAQNLSQRFGFVHQAEKNFNLKQALNKLDEKQAAWPKNLPETKNLRQTIIQNWLDKLV